MCCWSISSTRRRRTRSGMLRQLKQFVKQLPADEPVSLVTMASKIDVITSFQDGAGAASRYLEKKGLPPSSSPEPASFVERGAMSGMSSPDVQARTDIDRQAQHAQKTLDNFSALAKWLVQLSGEKECVLAFRRISVARPTFQQVGFDFMHPTGPAETGVQTSPKQEDTDKELQSLRGSRFIRLTLAVSLRRMLRV